MTNEIQKFGLMGFLLLIALASGSDIMIDLAHGASRPHLLQESVLLLLALIFLGWLIRDRQQRLRRLHEVQQTLTELQNFVPEPSQEMAAARHQLGEAILIQFEQWQLTPSEQEIGLLLLKGYSLKEIALLRGTAEKTIRQQASSIYQKSGVSGRHTFSAWFIEDLL